MLVAGKGGGSLRRTAKSALPRVSDQSSACHDEQAYYGIIVHGSDCFQQHIMGSLHDPLGMQLEQGRRSSG